MNGDQRTSQESRAMFKFMESPEYIEHIYSEAENKGEERNFSDLIKVDGDYISFTHDGVSGSPNRYASHVVHDNPRETYNRLVSAFGASKVEIESFSQGRSPSVAEFHQMQHGSDYYEFVNKQKKLSLSALDNYNFDYEKAGK